MKYIGVHVSSAGSLDQAVLRASNLGASAFAFFTKNQRQWYGSLLNEKKINDFKVACNQFNYSPHYILPHSSYLINLGHPDSFLLKKSRNAFIDELIRSYQLDLLYLNFHPGNHLNRISETICLKNIACSINLALESTEKIIAVIENTAGQGTSVGYKFEHLADIIDGVYDKSRVGVCIDTCHLFSSGYRIQDKEGFHSTFKEFDKIVGFKYLKGLHLNDSSSGFNSRVDRHANLGLGNIGKDFFTWIIKDIRFNNIPIILETTNKTLWKNEIKWLKSLSC